MDDACIWSRGWVVTGWLCCVYGPGFSRCSDHCCTGVRHCWNLTLSAELTGVKVLCCGIDLTDGSGDSSLIGGRGVSGCGDSGGVRNSSSSVDSCSGISGSFANMLKK